MDSHNFCKVRSFHCLLCEKSMECSLLEFRNHISESHMSKEDNLEGTMVDFQGIKKDRGENYLSIDDFLIQIQPEPTKPPRQLLECIFDACHFSHLDLVELKAHIHSKHDLQCPHCDFSDQENMEKHLKTVHANTKLYNCIDCQQIFPGPFSYWNHRKELHVPQTKEDIVENCVFCGWKPRSLKHLFEHVYSKHDPCCPQCNHVERNGFHMDQHFDKFHHIWNDVHSLKCSVWGCVKRFDSLQEYWRHRHETHPEAMMYNAKPISDSPAAKRQRLR